MCHWKRLYYKHQNGYFCTGNKFDFAFLYWPIAPISLCCTGSYHCTGTLQSLRESWCFTSKELGQPSGVPFYTQSYALPFYSTAPPWMAPGDDSTCCPAGHRPWGDPCTGSVETEPWLCCHFPDRYGLWGKEISMSTFTLQAFLILSILPCVFYTLLLLNSKHAESKQGKFSSFLFQSFFSGFSLSSPTSLWLCCFHTAGSWLAQDRETFKKHQNVHLTNAFLFSPRMLGRAKASLLILSLGIFPAILLKNILFLVDLSQIVRI